MKRTVRDLLVVLLVAVTVVPSDARAHQLGLGVGFVDGDCSVLSKTESERCFRGGRWELFWNFYMSGVERGERPSGAAAEASAVDASPRPHHGWLHYTNFGAWSSGDSDTLMVVFLLGLLLVAGIFWALVYLFSTRTKLGFFYSADVQEAPIILNGEREGIESYHVEKLGTQVSFYPARSVDIQLYFGAAAASARIRTYERDEGVSTYQLRGAATKAGIGYMPFPDPARGTGRHGPFLLAEFEGAFYGDSALRRSAEDRRKLVPEYRSNAAVMLGYTASW